MLVETVGVASLERLRSAGKLESRLTAEYVVPKPLYGIDIGGIVRQQQGVPGPQRGLPGLPRHLWHGLICGDEN
ncbi:Uncharacterised protein [Mycobacteroides abscessus subsp. abscessus]|nr:Uncharacterised protein [Mycobacteroides abscessus subsp. abscessus]